MTLHLVRILVRPPELLRFATMHRITQEEDGLGYTLHAWLAALFGDAAPKPFRYFDRRQELLAYAPYEAKELRKRAQTFSDPVAWAAFDPVELLSKPMPADWKAGQRVNIDVLTCPVSRKDSDEKDVFLRTLDRLSDHAPSRGEVYRQWFLRQWGDVVQFERLDLVGMQARAQLLRRTRNVANRLRLIERPQALFNGRAVIQDEQRFGELLGRGIGRHRAFGFGMVLLSPPR